MEKWLSSVFWEKNENCGVNSYSTPELIPQRTAFCYNYDWKQMDEFVAYLFL